MLQVNEGLHGRQRGLSKEGKDGLTKQVRALKPYIDSKLSVHAAKFAVIKADIEGLNEKIYELLEEGKEQDQKIQSLKRTIAQLKSEKQLADSPYGFEAHKSVAVDNVSTKSANEGPNKAMLMAFLANQEMQLVQYFDMFLFNGFESVQSLYGITHEDLKQIGVEKLGHRKQLIRSIRKEQERHRKQLMRLIKAKRKATYPQQQRHAQNGYPASYPRNGKRRDNMDTGDTEEW